MSGNQIWLAQQSKNPAFWEFLSETFGEIVQCEAQAINVVHWHLGGATESDIDDVPHIAAKFRDLVRLRYERIGCDENRRAA